MTPLCSGFADLRPKWRYTFELAGSCTSHDAFLDSDSDQRFYYDSQQTIISIRYSDFNLPLRFPCVSLAFPCSG